MSPIPLWARADAVYPTKTATTISNVRFIVPSLLADSYTVSVGFVAARSPPSYVAAWIVSGPSCCRFLRCPLRSWPNAGAPYRDARLPVDERVRDLVGRMTLEEKFWQLFMIPGDLTDSAHDYSHGIFGLQIAAPPGGARRRRADRLRPALLRGAYPARHPDHPVRRGGARPDARPAPPSFRRPSASPPPGTPPSWAEWPPRSPGDALPRHPAGALAGRQPRHRRPLGPHRGDLRRGSLPRLRDGPGLHGAIRAAGIVTTPKHFVANVGEGGRDSYPIALTAAPRGAVLSAVPRGARRRARSVMTAYNSVGGLPATQNPWLLTEPETRLGLPGLRHHRCRRHRRRRRCCTTPSPTPGGRATGIEAGVDVVFQTSYEQHRPYSTPSERLIPDRSSTPRWPACSGPSRARAVRDPYVNPDSAAYWNGHAHTPRAGARGRASWDRAAPERAGAAPAASDVPLGGPDRPDAATARLGGYSGPGQPVVSILAGITGKLGARGSGTSPARVVAVTAYAVVPREPAWRCTAEYFDNIALAGAPRFVRA